MHLQDIMLRNAEINQLHKILISVHVEYNLCSVKIAQKNQWKQIIDVPFKHYDRTKINFHM